MPYTPPLDHYRTLLARMLAALWLRLGVDAGGVDAGGVQAAGDMPAAGPATVTRRVHRAVLRALRPLEAAIRRVIFTRSRELVVDVPPPRSAGTGKARAKGKARTAPGRLPAFALLDTRQRFAPARRRRHRGPVPRIICLGPGPLYMPPAEPVRPEPQPGDPVPARALCRRLAVLQGALADLEGQALRMARHEARRKSAAHAARHKRVALSPLRPGAPPGHIRNKYRRAPEHKVLCEGHSMALRTLERKRIGPYRSDPRISLEL